MFKFNQSPSYWLLLGTLWSASLLLHVLEKSFATVTGYIIFFIGYGSLAVSSYAMAIYLTIKRKQPKEDYDKKDN